MGYEIFLFCLCKHLLNGLWGVFIVSVLSVVFLAGFAFLPSRY
jgi:hypothetical protein